MRTGAGQSRAACRQMQRFGCCWTWNVGPPQFAQQAWLLTGDRIGETGPDMLGANIIVAEPAQLVLLRVLFINQNVNLTMTSIQKKVENYRQRSCNQDYQNIRYPMK